MIFRAKSLLVLTIAITGCAAAKPAAPVAPSGTSPGAPAEPTAPERKPLSPFLGIAPSVVPKVPAECAAVTPLPERTSCERPLDTIIQGLSLGGAGALEALAPLEACDAFPPGYIRALRIELGPTECGDGLAEQLVGETGMLPNGPARDLLVAYGIAARLRRLAQDPPAPPGDREKSSLEAYFKNELYPWISAQAAAILTMQSEAVKLRGYARGVVAIEAGMADMRFVELCRNVPPPVGLETASEQRDQYFALLDEALEPRKRRGRDAALVGMRDLRAAGVLSDQRLTLARSLLSSVFAGGRVNALEKLVLPPFPTVAQHSGATRLASLLPVVFSEPLLSEQALSRDLVLAFLEQGIPLSVERSLGARADDESKTLLGLALLRRGLAYFSAEDFQKAAALLEGPAKAERVPGPISLSLGVATALSAGPKDAAALILEGPYFARSLGNLEYLDKLGEAGGDVAGPARFDSAYLRELAAPPGSPAVWSELISRYRDAAKLLKNPAKREAEERAAAASETLKALKKK
jgi:hypothetical protein